MEIILHLLRNRSAMSEITLEDENGMTNEKYEAGSDYDDSATDDDDSTMEDDDSVDDDDSRVDDDDSPQKSEPDYWADNEGPWIIRENVSFAKNQELYYIRAHAESCDDALYIDLLKKINCESGFIRRSRNVPRRFYAKLTEEQAGGLEGLDGVCNFIPASEIFAHPQRVGHLIYD